MYILFHRDYDSDVIAHSTRDANPMPQELTRNKREGDPQIMFNATRRSTGCRALTLTTLSSGASAETTEQPSDDVLLEEMVVTVERRSQSLQDYAGTAAAFTGEELKSLGVQNIQDLDRFLPGFSVANNGGNIEVYIRGIGSSNNTELGDPAAATHLNGVYVPRPSGFGSAFFDIERVEVNIGPQGTLRGRNATAGSVDIIPWKPGLGITDASVEASIGNYGEWSVEGMVNVPVGEISALRVAGFILEHDSYYDDKGPADVGVAEAAENWGGRLTYLVEPNDQWRFTLTGDYISEQGTGYTGTNYANPLGNGIDPSDIKNPRNVIGRAFEPIQDTEHWGFKGHIEWSGDRIGAEYIGSYRDLVYDYTAATPLAPDYPGVLETLQPADENFDNFSQFRSVTDSESMVHELRLFSTGDGPLQWTAGVFYFEEEQRSFLGATGDRGLFYSGQEFNQRTDTESFAVYADATYSITDRVRLTGGVRYTDDDKQRYGVNARYGFALGAGDFNCCGGVRVGTEGFEFNVFDRTIFNPDTDGDGLVSDQETLDFYFDGVASFGARDNVDDVFANGAFGFVPEGRAECLDTIADDYWVCADDGLLTYAVPFPGQIALQNGALDDDFTDWRVRLEYDVSDSSLLYGLVATGNKSGGFNDNVPGTEGLGPVNPAGNAPAAFDTETLAPTYDSEKVTLYEIGIKNEFDLGNTLAQVNLSGFYYDYKDLVLNSLVSTAQILDFVGVDPEDIDPALQTQVVNFGFNASDAEIYGAQLEASFMLPDDWTIRSTLLWLEAEVQNSQEIQDSRFQADVSPAEAVNQSIEGKRLPRTPRWQLNASLAKSWYVRSGRVDWITSVGFRDSQYMTIFNGEDYQQPEDPRLRLDDKVDGYWTVDMGAAYVHGEGDSWTVEAYVANLTDEENEQAIIITQFDNTRFFQRPRTYGLRFRYRM